jgi:hypothetical protein
MCTDIVWNGFVPDSRMVGADWWVGGLTSGVTVNSFCEPGTPQWQYLAVQDPGSTFTRESGDGYQYGAAVQLPYISLGAKTSYSKRVRYHWEFGQTSYVCGNNDVPVRSTTVYTSR